MYFRSQLTRSCLCCSVFPVPVHYISFVDENRIENGFGRKITGEWTQEVVDWLHLQWYNGFCQKKKGCVCFMFMWLCAKREKRKEFIFVNWIREIIELKKYYFNYLHTNWSFLQNSKVFRNLLASFTTTIQFHMKMCTGYPNDIENHVRYLCLIHLRIDQTPLEWNRDVVVKHKQPGGNLAVVQALNQQYS